MKILEINKFYYLKGGAERHLFELSDALLAAGHTVTTFSMKHAVNRPSIHDRYFTDEVRLDRFSLKNIVKTFYNWQALAQLENLIRAEKPDIAHLHNIQYQLGPAIIQLLKKYRIPVVQTLHAYNIICPNARLYTGGKPCERCNGRKFYNCVIHRCVHDSYAKSLLASLEAYLNVGLLKRYDEVDLFISPSQFMKEACVRAGLPAGKIVILRNFIDLDKFEPASVATDDYLLYFGRLSEEKGVETLVKAVKDIPNQSLKIVGDGPTKNNLQFLISNFQLNERVELLGHKSGEELNEIMANAKAVIIPSLWPENMPYSLLEAMAMGKVVLAARSGGMPELIKDKYNGFLFTPGDANELRNLIRSLKDLDLAAIGAKARGDAAAILSPVAYSEKLLSIFGELVKK